MACRRRNYERKQWCYDSVIVLHTILKRREKKREGEKEEEEEEEEKEKKM